MITLFRQSNPECFALDYHNTDGNGCVKRDGISMFLYRGAFRVTLSILLGVTPF